MSPGWSLIYGALLVVLLSCSQGCGTINSIVLLNLGNMALNSGQYPEALDKYKRGLEQAQNSSFKREKTIGHLLFNLGMVSGRLGQYDRALEYYQQSLAVKRELKDRRGEGDSLNNLGAIYEDLGQYERALEYFQQGLAIRRELKDRRAEGGSLNNVGTIYENLCQNDSALEYFQQALTIARETKDRPGEGLALNNLGVIYARLGQQDRTLECYQQSLAIRKETKDRQGEGDTLNNLGVVCENLGQYERALEYCQQALTIHRETKDRRGEADNLNRLGAINEALGHYDQALKILQESLNICREVGAPITLFRAQRGLGEVDFRLGSYGEALAHYRQALDTIEGMRAGLSSKESKTIYMKDKLIVYDQLIEHLRSLHEKYPTKGYDRESLEIFERKQGRLFLEEMGQSGARNFAGLPEKLRTQETELENRLDSLQTVLVQERLQPQPDRQRLQTLETELSQTRQAFQALKAELQTKHPDYYAMKYPQPAKLADLQGKVLKPGEVMLVYGVMEAKTCLWVIGKKFCGLYTLPLGEEDLKRKIGALRRTILKAGDARQEVAVQPGLAEKVQAKPRQELYGLLLPASVRSALPAGSRLYIIPTGPLYALPFETLETQAADEPPRYLVEDYAIAYLSSASLLKTLREAQARKQAQPPYPLLAFANPRYGRVPIDQKEDKSVRGLQTRAFLEIMGGSFAELPETEGEAREIKDILKAPEQSNPLIVKDAASRSKILSLNQDVRLSAYRYLVFACHGILPGEVDRVVQPALVLAHPEKDGFLTMADVFGLKLNAELVSLSACNTGRGSHVRGEGVVGLTRSFMYAGTPAVAVTLWSVESNSAKELNVGMYRYLSQKHGRATALQEIKLALLRGEKGNEYRNPFFWAPLVVFGDGQ
jgi:CHAT domain-containing protein/tetratricopeptide (TPR) repeat protein